MARTRAVCLVVWLHQYVYLHAVELPEAPGWDDLRGRAPPHQLPAGEQRHPVAEKEGVIGIVRGPHPGNGASHKRLAPGTHPHLVAEVEARGSSTTRMRGSWASARPTSPSCRSPPSGYKGARQIADLEGAQVPSAISRSRRQGGWGRPGSHRAPAGGGWKPRRASTA